MYTTFNQLVQMLRDVVEITKKLKSRGGKKTTNQ